MVMWLAATVAVMAVAGVIVAYWLAVMLALPGVPRLPVLWAPLAEAGSLLVVAGLFSWLACSLLAEIRRVRRVKGESDLFADAVKKTGNAVFMVSPEGTIEWVNEGFTRLTGYTEAEMAGKPASVLTLGQLHTVAFQQRMRDGFAALRAFNLEICCTHKRGHRVWLLLDFTPVVGPLNNVVTFVGVGTDMTGRRRAEEQLAVLNRRTAMLLDAVGEGVCGLDLQGNITFCNPAALRMLGWEQAELLGQPVSTILYQLRVDQLCGGAEDLFTAAAFLDGTVLIGDTDFFRRKDGGTFPVEYTSTPVKEGEEMVGTVVAFRDATERRQTDLMRTRQARQFAFRAEVAFALSAGNSLRSFLQRTSQVMVKQLDGTYARIWTLNEAEDMLELQASAGLYTHINGHHGRIPVGTLKVGMIAKHRIPEATNDLINDPNVGDRQWVVRERMVAFVGFPLLLENRVIGVMAMFSRNRLPDDALELLGSVADMVSLGIVRKRAEEKVIEQAALLDKSQDAIIVTDLEGRCTFWNKCAERIYGHPNDAVLGQPVQQLICPDQAYFERARREVLAHGEWRDDNCQVSRGHETVTVESQWTLVQDDAGQPKTILIVNTDITEKKKIESQFLRTQRIESIGTLAGGIAHDLNNVLAPILMSVEILRQKLTDEQSQRMLPMLESSAKRGAGMVKQLLTFARGVDGERVLLQPKHLIKEIAKIITETFPKTIQIRTKIPDDLWTINGDATQLHQVLVNLTVNARDAMPNAGIITITAENTVVRPGPETDEAGLKPGNYVVLKVADTGTGIPREILDKVFEPFFTTKPVGKGTGLGLSTVLGIVKSHGGTVLVQTEVNRGTTFVIYLPASENAQPQASDGDVGQLPSGQGELLLAVDDEPAVLAMTRETLESFGYRVLTAADGTEAVALFTVHRTEIQAVLTDMLMPHMDGPATIRVLRKLDPNLKIIAASGLLDNERVRDATGMENIPFLMKPYTAERLLTTIHQVLHEPAAAAA